MSKRVYTWELSDSESDSESSTKHSYTNVFEKDGKTTRVPQINEPSEEQSNSIVILEEEEDEASAHTNQALQPPTLAEPNTPSPGKKRRTREEIDADRIKAEERKAQREKAKQERERKKEEKRQEQQKRKEDLERLKSFRPENYVKCLIVRIHPVLLQDENSDVLTETLSELEWKSCIEPLSLTNSISWARSISQEDGENEEVEEEQMLMVVSFNEFMDIVLSVKQVYTPFHM